MKKNIGTNDRIIRLILGLVALLIAWYTSSWILLAVSLFLFYEAIASWCALYQLLGKNSCDVDLDKK